MKILSFATHRKHYAKDFAKTYISMYYKYKNIELTIAVYKRSPQDEQSWIIPP